MNELLTKYRTAVYVGANAILFLVCGVLTIANGGPIGEFVYVACLFSVCSSCVLCLDAINGRYALLAIFMALYFLYFGVLDLTFLVTGADGTLRTGFITEAECALVSGSLLVLGGYRFGVKLAGSRKALNTASDWSATGLLLIGTLLWLTGSAAIVYFQVYAVPEKTIAAANRGFASLGPIWTFMLMLGQMIEPLGIVIIAYGYARYRTTGWLSLTLAMVLLQIAIGFVSDIKSVAMLGAILVILARTLVDSRLPKAWILGGALFVIFTFPMFQAYRAEISGERGLNHHQALENLGKVMEIVLANRDKVMEKPAAERSQTFFERASLKDNVELAFGHTGIDTAFQGGRTLIEIPAAFIPRLLWPGKPDVSTGTLFNKEFIRTGQADTNISPSHIGELYWNFGWPGVVVGMALIGTILGFVGSRYNLADGASVTRLLVLLATAKYVCLGFEGTMAVPYVLWLRSLGAVGLLHLILTRQQRQRVPVSGATETEAALRQGSTPNDFASGNRRKAAWEPGATEPARFPNLMR